MKKALSILMVLVMTISLAACGEQKSVEERFLLSLTKALEKKWTSEAGMDEVTKESLMTVIDAECKALEEYSDAVFENSELGELAKRYISILDEKKAALEKYETAEWDSIELELYRKSSRVLAEINDIITIVVSEEWKTNFETAVNDGKKSVDEWFMLNLAKGLESRWFLAEKNEKNDTVTKEDWESYFSAEDNFINNFKDETFEDKNLEKWSKEYINCIVQSKEALKYFGTNQWDSKYTNGIYQDRAQALYNINAIVPVPVSEQWQENLDGLVINGEVSDMVYKLLESVKFKETADEYGWKTYECIVENTTNTNFEYFAFNVDLIDEDGVTVRTESAYAEQWSAGEKTRFIFETDEKFEKMNIVSAEWYF